MSTDLSHITFCIPIVKMRDEENNQDLSSSQCFPPPLFLMTIISQR